MQKRIAILGSTGSIGTNALEVIEALGPEYQLVALTGHNKIDLLAQQVGKFSPAVVAVTNEANYSVFKQSINGYSGQVLSGPDSLVEIASSDDVDIVLCGVVGAAGLPAVLAAAQAGKTIAIANKEPLVVAGRLLTETARQTGAKLLPVDSEHSAIFQAMQSGQPEEVRKIVLTASGGPFRGASKEDMANASLAEALNHPTWDMGPKITIDSATMMNKALEVIEAVWLFDTPVDKIGVLVHPESVVHSMVEFVDGSVIAQLGTPDMKVPIQYALTYPNRKLGIAQGLDLEQMGQLNFESPDLEVFRALKLGFEVARMAESAAVVFNAANEAAVDAFLKERIRFVQIVELIEQAIDAHPVRENLTLEELLEVDAWARRFVGDQLDSKERLGV